jgi:hypothetical protein
MRSWLADGLQIKLWTSLSWPAHGRVSRPRSRRLTVPERSRPAALPYHPPAAVDRQPGKRYALPVPTRSYPDPEAQCLWTFLAWSTMSHSVSTASTVWASVLGSGDVMPTGNEGVLESVTRKGEQLRLTMRFDDREHVTFIEWDRPPSLDEVERVLKLHLGEPRHR